MQMLQGNEGPTASGKRGLVLPAPHCRKHGRGGLIKKEKLFPWATRSPMPGLGSCLYFWPLEPATVPRVGWITPCTPFSP